MMELNWNPELDKRFEELSLAYEEGPPASALPIQPVSEVRKYVRATVEKEWKRLSALEKDAHTHLKIDLSEEILKLGRCAKSHYPYSADYLEGRAKESAKLLGHPATQLDMLLELVSLYEEHLGLALDELENSLQEQLRDPSDALVVYEWLRDYEPVMSAAVTALLSHCELRKSRKCKRVGRQEGPCCKAHDRLAELVDHHTECQFEYRDHRCPGIPRFESGANYPELIGPIRVENSEEHGGSLRYVAGPARTTEYETLDLVDLLKSTAQRFLSQSPRKFELKVDESKKLCILRDHFRESVIDGINDRLKQYDAVSRHSAL